MISPVFSFLRLPKPDLSAIGGALLGFFRNGRIERRGITILPRLPFRDRFFERGAIIIMPSSLTGLQLGVETAETGINVTRFVCRYYLEVNRKLINNFGQTRGRARADAFSRDVEIEGEVTGSTGLMAVTIAAAVTVANDIATFGTTPGILLLDEVTETQTQAEFRTVNFRLSSDPLLTSV